MRAKQKYAVDWTSRVPEFHVAFVYFLYAEFFSLFNPPAIVRYIHSKGES